MVDRIRALLAWRKLSPTQFADLLQVGRPVISHILSGRNKASLEVVQRVIAAFPEVTLPWLLTGTGPMLAADPALSGGAPALRTALGLTTTERADEAATLPPEPTGKPELFTKSAKGPRVISRSEGLGSVSAQLLTSGREAAPVVSPTAPLAGSAYGLQPRRKFNLVGASAPSDRNLAEPAGIKSPDEGAGQRASTNAEDPFARRETPLATSIPAPAKEYPEPAQQMPRTGDLRVASSNIIGSGVNNEAARALPTTNRPIRRIVIFYQDGSFADFQPEA